MIGAAKKGGESDGGGENIGNVAAAGNAGAQGNAESVKAIASGMKGIVEAAKKAGVELKAAAVAGGDNKDAGKLFATNGGGHAHANTAAINNAAKAVSGVSGDQILNAIVTSGDGNGANAGAATNPIEAAIGGNGGDGQAFGENMNTDDKIAAAIVLRGMAKDGKFALADAADASKESLKATVESAVSKTIEWLKEMIGAAKKGGEKNDGGGDIGNVAEAGSNGAKGDEGSVKAIASGMKGIVDAAKKAGVDLKADAVNGGGNEDAGKLFATDGGGANANAAAVNKAAKAVSGVSGDQILNAIVTSGNGGNGANAQAATNPIDAAIGAAGDNGQAFDGMTADDKIAAAIVLRGMAKDGKFALTNAARDSKESLKAAWLKEMIEAAKKGGEKSGGEGDIGNVEAGGGNGAKGNEESVRAIASGMKGIVEAAKKAGVELKAAAGGNGNADAGKLFATNGGGHNGANANAVNNVVKAISGVSGDQILNAIVTSGDGNGKKAQEATNPIDAAIGGNDDNGQAFDGMTADDKIAAAIVLRGMAKDGKFALANAASKESLKATVVKGNDRSF